MSTSVSVPVSVSTTDAAHAPAGASRLDHAFELRGANLLMIGWIVAVAAAVALRLSRLDQWALSQDEARMALDAWRLYTGAPGGVSTHTGPLPLLLDAFSFFLFGVTDATFRLPDALAGLAMLPLALMLPPHRVRIVSWGMATKLAVSPTLVYASRTGDGQMLAAVFVMLAACCLLWAGRPETDAAGVRRCALGIGFAVAAALASAPAAVLAFFTLAIGVAFSIFRVPEGQVRHAVSRLAAPSAWGGALAVFAATAVLLFTRLLTAPEAIAGLPQTFGDALLILTREQPNRLGIMALLMIVLYEPVSLLLGIFVGRNVLAPLASLRMMLAAWAISAMLLWGFAAGAEPHHIVHVSLPIVLLGGVGLAGLVAGIDWHDVRRGPGLALLFAVLGALISGVAAVILFGRSGQEAEGIARALPAVAVIVLVFVPLIYAITRLSAREREEGRDKQPTRLTLFAMVLVIAAWAISTSTHFVIERQGTGREPLARHASTGAVKPTVERLGRLGRDAGIGEGSLRDVAGGHALSVAIDERVAQPWAWYLRDFPDAKVVPAGSAGQQGAQVAIAPAGEDLAGGGYTVTDVPTVTGVPETYRNPDLPDLLRRIVLPEHWVDGVRFLLLREGVDVPAPESVSLGLDRALSGRVAPSTEPAALGDQAGPGAAPGQFNGPVGVAVGADGTVYAMDGGNVRLQRFAADGTFLGAWGGGENGIEFASPSPGLGPTGVTVAPDGTVWLADTWNHRVLQVSPDGQLLRQIGSPDRQPFDIGDDPTQVTREPGMFFGPRSVAVTGDAVYVADTGNERIQVFAPDGTFQDAFGGYGTGPGNLIEPVGIAVGPDGRLYVADSGNQRISVFNRKGKPLRQFTVAAWPPPDPTGLRPSFQPYLAFGPDGLLYVSSSASGTVEVYDPESGQLLSTLRSDGGRIFDQPIGVAVSPSGELVISDYGLNAVLTGPLPGVEVPGEAAATPVG